MLPKQGPAEEARQANKRKPSLPEDSPSSRGVSQPAERGADAAHYKMKQLWEERYDYQYNQEITSQLNHVLFLKRKPLKNAAGAFQPGKEHEVDEDSTAFASEEETRQGILSVLQLRHAFLYRKDIEDLRHVLTPFERSELAKSAREAYEMSGEQLDLQARDEEKGSAKGKPPATKGKGKARGKTHGKGGVANFVRQQKRKRWCRHLQRVCGTKQVWEVLAFTGCFDVDFLRTAIQSPDAEKEPEISATASEQKQKRRALHHAKAEAKKAFNEGKRLARQRGIKRQGNASQSAGSDQEAVIFSKSQLDVLKQWDRGLLRVALNQAIAEFGHGRLESQTGDFLDIGGSTGGGSRRIIDDWVPRDWREFLNNGNSSPE